MTRDVPSEDLPADPTQVPAAQAPADVPAAAPESAPVEKHHGHKHDDAVDEKSGMSIKTKLILGAIVIAVVIGLYFWLRQMAPRWWGDTVAGWVAGEMSKGIWYGLLFGAVGALLFIVLLLLALEQWMKHRNWLSIPLSVLAVAAVVPMILTLGIVTGSNSGADAGKIALNTFAPGFRGAMLIGLIVGVVAGFFLDYLILKERRDRDHKKKLAEKANS